MVRLKRWRSSATGHRQWQERVVFLRGLLLHFLEQLNTLSIVFCYFFFALTFFILHFSVVILFNLFSGCEVVQALLLLLGVLKNTEFNGFFLHFRLVSFPCELLGQSFPHVSLLLQSEVFSILHHCHPSRQCLAHKICFPLVTLSWRVFGQSIRGMVIIVQQIVPATLHGSKGAFIRIQTQT